ncbi:hypothetical protein PMAYCL1PPCAC_15737, partial [Pristionchus mayeri]
KPIEPPFPLRTKFPSRFERAGYKIYYAKIGVVSLATAYVPVLCLCSILHRIVFSYKGWLFENPKNPSISTKTWAVLRSILHLVPPRLNSCESLLPRMPVPPIEQTVERYLVSIEELHSKEELAKIDALARQFLAGESRKLQRMTQLYSLIVNNYVSRFWEKFATRASRAARVAYIETQSQLAIDSQTLKPAAGGMISANNMDKQYAMTREPGEKTDRLIKYGISKHIVVIYNGGIYKVHTVDESGRIYTTDQLTDIFIELLARKNTSIEGAAGRVPALTTDNRSQWFRNRRRFFEQIPKNARALREIESAIVVLTLDEATGDGYGPDAPEKLAKFEKKMLAGEGDNRWADKSLNYVVLADGSFGGIVEHSGSDGCEFGQIQEIFSYMEQHIVPYAPMDEQLRREREFDAEKSGLRFAELLEIDVDNEMAAEIDLCFTAYQKEIDNVHISSLIFRDWGKDRIKQFRCSPDAFLQMAIQLANYRDQGRFSLTYEAASPRFYRDSRTETLRTVTEASCAFVRAMEDESVDRAERVNLLRAACGKHANNNRECMVGKGIDRHLFVLYVMAKASGTPSAFLDHCMQQEWLLSTTQPPNIINNRTEDGEYEKFAWMCGCFGAVAETGYG